MRHRIKGRKLNRTASHRKAMLTNMAVSLIEHEQVHTTLPKAKELRPFVEKLITLAKKNDLSARRRIISKTRSEEIAKKLIGPIAEKYNSRQGGYTRIVKAGYRYGDMAPMAYIQLVDSKKEIIKTNNKK